MNVFIREARLDDAEGIISVLNPIIEAGKYTILDTLLTVEAERGFIAEFPERGIFHVAQTSGEGRIVGFQTLEPFATYTHACDHVAVIATYVDLERRRQGIGGRLFAVTFDAARRKGYEKIFTYVRADNPAARAAYLNEGFRVVGIAERHARLRDGRYVDDLIIEKFL